MEVGGRREWRQGEKVSRKGRREGEEYGRKEREFRKGGKGNRGENI